jgi:hypothetical protein
MIHWLWKRLTVAMLREGYAEIYMRHYIASQSERLVFEARFR